MFVSYWMWRKLQTWEIKWTETFHIKNQQKMKKHQNNSDKVHQLSQWLLPSGTFLSYKQLRGKQDHSTPLGPSFTVTLPSKSQKLSSKEFYKSGNFQDRKFSQIANLHLNPDVLYPDSGYQAHFCSQDGVRTSTLASKPQARQPSCWVALVFVVVVAVCCSYVFRIYKHA